VVGLIVVESIHQFTEDTAVKDCKPII